jgi:hypothetical protein
LRLCRGSGIVRAAMTGNSTFDTLLIGVFAAAAASAVVLVLINAPYGRHDRPGWGPSIPTRVAWVLMESPSSVGFALWYVMGPQALAPVPLVFFALWQAHYFHRTFIYPFQLRVGAKGTRLLTAAMGATFNAVNAYLNGTYLATYGSHLTSAWLLDPRCWLGVALFAGGYVLNRQSDAILRNLRRPGETGYKIPYGGGFRFVSCPNYLGELIEWLGWAVATWSLAGLAFFAFTAANLVPRAAANHRWYRERFHNYPPDRRAILPFVF